MINESKSTIDKIRGWLVWIAVAMCTYYSINDFVSRKGFENIWTLAPICLILYFSAYCYLKEKKNLSTWSFLFGTQAFMTYLIMISGGLKAPGVFWFASLPILWAALLGVRGMIVGYSSILIIYVSFYIMGDSIVLPKYMPEGSEQLFTARLENLIVFSTFVFLFMFGYTRILKKAQVEVEQKNVQVETLLRILLHDISNSLQLAQFQQDLMKTKQTYEDARMDKAIKHTYKINQIINDVRELFALSQGKLNINIGKACIKESTNSALEYLNDKIQSKNINIQFTAPSEECFAEIDPSIYENQIITNILTNAIKFSQDGGEIKIDLYQEDHLWNLTVTDNGIGIPEDILKNLFATDVPTSRPGTNGEKGTGFGMPIVEQLVTKFSGNIEVFSPPKSHFPQGTQVHLKFKHIS